jgi:hypothetical protein
MALDLWLALRAVARCFCRYNAILLDADGMPIARHTADTSMTWCKLRAFAVRYPPVVPHISRITAGASFGSMPRERRNAS